MNRIERGIITQCLESINNTASEASDLCERGKTADMDEVLAKVEIMKYFISNIYDLLETHEPEVVDSEEKSSKRAYVDEINKTYYDFLHYQRLEDMRKGEGENPENWKVNKDEI